MVHQNNIVTWAYMYIVLLSQMYVIIFIAYHSNNYPILRSYFFTRVSEYKMANTKCACDSENILQETIRSNPSNCCMLSIKHNGVW